ncbi:MAG TPA: PilN domain-containing protein, partial [Candidatus Methylomirabilis sp.]|nr:PilN domain-containing protein [Candidatus Methylomirabilis sp.]
EELTRLLPDNTWVQQFDVKNVGKVREVQISGETASSSKLIEILEGSTLLQNAAFRGTVTRGQTQGTERFLIAAEVRPRPQPETKSVLDVMSGVPDAPVKLKPAAVPAQAAPTAPSASAAAPAPKAGWPKK